jgi:hypothetical protein
VMNGCSGDASPQRKHALDWRLWAVTVELAMIDTKGGKQTFAELDGSSGFVRS